APAAGVVPGGGGGRTTPPGGRSVAGEVRDGQLAVVGAGYARPGGGADPARPDRFLPAGRLGGAGAPDAPASAGPDRGPGAGPRGPTGGRRMSTVAVLRPGVASLVRARLADYLELTKPRIAAL